MPPDLIDADNLDSLIEADNLDLLNDADDDIVSGLASERSVLHIIMLFGTAD
jgi:hypothetical protein